MAAPPRVSSAPRRNGNRSASGARAAAFPAVAGTAGQLSARVEPTRVAPQACVVIGIPFRVDYWVLNALEAGGAAASSLANRFSEKTSDAELFDQSVVAFCAFEAAREKLSGTTVDAIKNKVVDSACGAQGGEFLVSVTCAPTLAATRKCAGIVLQKLQWGMLYQRYESWCKILGARPDKAAFSHAAATANAAVRAGVTIVFTGKVEADASTLARSLTLLARQVKDSEPREPGRPRGEVVLVSSENGPDSEKNPPAGKYVTRSAPGLLGVIVHNFVDSNIRGEPSHLVSGVLHIATRKVAQAKRLAAGPKTDKYAASFLRLGPESRGALVYIAAKGCYVETAALSVAGGLTTAAAVAAIREALA